MKLTPLDEWIERGERGRFVVKRVRGADARLSVEALRKMRLVGEQLAGKDYDPYFEWSDDRIYCSELVWKVFERGAGIELGELQTIAAFDLSHPTCKRKSGNDTAITCRSTKSSSRRRPSSTPLTCCAC